MIEYKEYKGYKIYYLTEEDKFLELGKEIIDKKIEIFQEFKVTQRNYVAGILYEGNKYILKSPRNEYRISQRKLQTLFKKGEALTTLININKLIDKGFKEFVKPLLVGVKRENGMICDSFLVMEYEEGRKFQKEDLKTVVDFGKKLHALNHYHGDFNISNFLMTEKGLKVIDAQGKSFSLGTYRKHYEALTFAKDLFVLEQGINGEKMFEYPKDVFYYLAAFIKGFKHTKVISEIRKKKKKLRDKGWKI